MVTTNCEVSAIDTWRALFVNKHEGRFRDNNLLWSQGYHVVPSACDESKSRLSRHTYILL